jgi:hypothetical protein
VVKAWSMQPAGAAEALGLLSGWARSCSAVYEATTPLLLSGLQRRQRAAATVRWCAIRTQPRPQLCITLRDVGRSLSSRGEEGVCVGQGCPWCVFLLRPRGPAAPGTRGPCAPPVPLPHYPTRSTLVAVWRTAAWRTESWGCRRLVVLCSQPRG